MVSSSHSVNVTLQKSQPYDLLRDLTDVEIATSDFGTNTADEYFDVLFRLTQYRTDPELSEILVRRSLDMRDALRRSWCPDAGGFWRPLLTGMHALPPDNQTALPTACPSALAAKRSRGDRQSPARRTSNPAPRSGAASASLRARGVE